MTVSVYTAGISILLTRLVNRTQSAQGTYASPFETVDLTPYFGTAGTVTTAKMIDQPCGAFSVTFADKMHPLFADTVYALCEPMDMVEIRMARQPEVYQGADLPLVMRGFVSTISREETMSMDGTPTRAVRLTGQDSGKLLEIYRIMFMFEVAHSDQSYIEAFKLSALTGMTNGVIPVSQFITEVISQVVNPKISRLVQFTNEKVKPFQTDLIDPSVPGLVMPAMVASIDSLSAWQLMNMFADRPWNELFVQDAEDGPHLVFRQVPYKDYETGAFIMSGAVDPGTLDLDIEDVVALSVQRSDARVANFFWVPPGATQLDSSLLVTATALAQGWPLDLEHDANNPRIFGQRLMAVGTMLTPSNQTQPIMMLAEGHRTAAAGDIVTWMQARGRQLMNLNRDNSVFVEGGAVVKGWEWLTPGKYLRITRGDIVAEYYIEGVTHNFAPLSTWTTQLRLIRGTEFKVRLASSGSPYVQEGFGGPYTP
jgi:hypothetical protein